MVSVLTKLQHSSIVARTIFIQIGILKQGLTPSQFYYSVVSAESKKEKKKVFMDTEVKFGIALRFL